jgi:hypoxanthine phosphoribosyltransferase
MSGLPLVPSPFAHASEAELARILDFYGVAWEYEPRAFPILWNLDGEVVESFAPDFYLPELDLYLEIATLRQKLVRKKNRKLRRLRELYPGINIKLFYARDFRALLLKYGKLALAGSLSGSEGQMGAPPAVPRRPAAAPAGHEAVSARFPASLPRLEPGVRSPAGVTTSASGSPDR